MRRSVSVQVLTVLLVPLLGAGGTARGQGPLPENDESARAIHVLNRLGYGPRPGDVDRIVAMGVERWIEQQLYPERIDDRDLERQLARFEVLTTTPAQLAAADARARRARRALAMRADSAGMRPQPLDRPAGRRVDVPDELRRVRRLGAELQQLVVVRAANSERQLYEVMVDFWTNHFNVFAGKGPVRPVLPSYVEETIRPNALGRFEDLLVAVARSPAMLLYLDNAQSVTPGTEPPQVAQLRQRIARGQMAPRQRRQGPRDMRGGNRGTVPPDSALRRLEARLPKGINENYARELLELHTLGVDGGYTQDDVVNVARILTGWSVTRPDQGARFTFNEWAHDREAKVVLGVQYPAGRGMEEGLELLHMLARHPSTRRHLGAKLCERFVADDAPAGCVDAAAAAWERSDGDIREVLAAIFASADFWAPEYRGAKTKTPLEFVVSAVRAIGAHPDTGMALAQIVGRLGQPLYGQQPPTGYPETQESWVNSGALLQRLNVAMGLAAGRLPGVRAEPDTRAALRGTGDLVAAVNSVVLNGQASQSTLRVMREQVETPTDAREALALAVGLALGSPEFQRQ